MATHSIVNDWVQELDIADGLKQLLIDAGLTIESGSWAGLSRDFGKTTN
jgi:hypothetical protein